MMRLAWRFGALLLLAGCGDDETSVDCEAPGVACTWLGRPGEVGFDGDGHGRLDTKLYWTMDMLFASDGTPWFIDWNNHLVRRVRSDDTIETVVGWTDPIFPGDGAPGGAEKTTEGAPGTEVQLNHPTDMAELPDGTILLMAWHNHKLRAIDPATGRVRSDDGTLYFTDVYNHCVRAIDPDGTIRTAVGICEQAGYAGDGGPATSALLKRPYGLEWADGVLYVSDTGNSVIRAVRLR